MQRSQLSHTRRQRGHALRRAALVVQVVFDADGDLSGADRGLLFRLAVDVGLDRRPEGVDGIHAHQHQEEVEEVLRVQRQDVRQARVRFKKM